MKQRPQRWIPWLVILLPLAAIVASGVLTAWYFTQRLAYYAEVENRRYFKEAVEQVEHYNDIRIGDFKELILYRDRRLEETMRRTLKSRVDLAYDTAEYLFERYRKKLDEATLKSLITDALSQMVWENKAHYVWITDYKGNNLLAANVQLQKKNLYDYKDADGEYIIRKEIEVASKEGAGFLKTHFASKEDEQLLYVRRFGRFDWLLGSALSYRAARKALQTKLIRLVEEIVWAPNAFMLLYDAKGRLLSKSGATEALDRADLNLTALPEGEWERRNDLFLKRERENRYGWQIVTGFTSQRYLQLFDLRSEALQRTLEREKTRIAEAVAAIALLVGLLSLLLARKINTLFTRYREQIRVREEALKEFNATLEAQVEAGIEKQRQSEKMLVQQSKMAAMGDMISMIAHQWRQPLNHLSYMLMNIEGAHEHGELSADYLRQKLSEADKTLEYMSHTIDDFRNFFRPDKSRESVAVAGVVEQTLALLDKSFAAHNIAVKRFLECDKMLSLYRNELIQVLINVLQNAKDALLERRIASPEIVMTCYTTGQFVVVRICDNAGGVSPEALEHLFEPYFSTKQQRQGSGLGLYMSRTIIEEHFNGELTFENTEAGACFLIKIGLHQLTGEA